MNHLYIAMYHYTRNLKNSRYPNIKGLDISIFRKQIEYMKAHFNIVTMEQVLEATKGGTPLPENALLLTFDDGYTDHYTFAFPVLQNNGIQGSFFIPTKTFSTHKLLDVNKIHYILASADIQNLITDVKREMDFYRGQEYQYPSTDDLFHEYATSNRFDTKETIFVKRMLQTVLPEKLRSTISSKLFEKYVGVTEEQLAHELYLTEDQIRTMKNNGMFIGIHGHNHYWLSNLPTTQMKNDIHTALNTLDEFIDRSNWVMCYPYGDYNEDVLHFIKSEGAVVGLTTEVRVSKIGHDDPLTLPRFDCNDFPPKSTHFTKY